MKYFGPSQLLDTRLAMDTERLVMWKNAYENNTIKIVYAANAGLWNKMEIMTYPLKRDTSVMECIEKTIDENDVAEK